MKTVWGEQLDPNAVLQEYPRPQMMRESYRNLNGLWDYATGTEKSLFRFRRRRSFPVSAGRCFPASISGTAGSLRKRLRPECGCCSISAQSIRSAGSG